MVSIIVFPLGLELFKGSVTSAPPLSLSFLDCCVSD